jgi:hypothetical protein
MPVRWHGRLSRFSPVREGGPGRRSTLVGWLLANLATLWWGIRLVEQHGIDGIGPAAVVIAAASLLIQITWVLIKAVLRPLAVTFCVDARGVEILPSKEQRSLDRKLRRVSLVVFWLTWRGGQWSEWKPSTPWKQVKRVVVDEIAREVLVQGGPWDIRLLAMEEKFAAVCEAVAQRAPKRTRVVHIRTLG